MSIIDHEFDGPPSWSLNVSRTGESTKWVYLRSHGKWGTVYSLLLLLLLFLLLLLLLSLLLLQLLLKLVRLGLHLKDYKVVVFRFVLLLNCCFTFFFYISQF